MEAEESGKREVAHIKRLHLKNVRMFNELDIEFGPDFNFLTGPNGCGKTSILAGISHCFSSSNYSNSRFGKDAEFWVDIDKGDIKYRLGQGAGGVTPKDYRQSALEVWVGPPYESGRETLTVNNATKSKHIPLIVGAARSIKYKKISGMVRELTQEESSKKYKDEFSSRLYGESPPEVKQWLINRYFIIDKPWAGIERKNWNRLVSCLPKIGPFDSEFSFVEIGRDLEPVFSLYGRKCYLEELSSGFQAVLSIIANIFEWIESSQDESTRGANAAEGTVLIDELDLHLHPEWQFTLRDGLRAVFPKLQFIVTTHSPHLLASAKSGEVIILSSGVVNGGEKISATKKTFSGWSTDQILSEVMGVKSLENKDYEHVTAMALDSIERGSVEDLSKNIKRLEEVCHPNDTIVTVLKARMAAMVAMIND